MNENKNDNINSLFLNCWISEADLNVKRLTIQKRLGELPDAANIALDEAKLNKLIAKLRNIGHMAIYALKHNGHWDFSLELTTHALKFLEEAFPVLPTLKKETVIHELMEGPLKDWAEKYGFPEDIEEIPSLNRDQRRGIAKQYSTQNRIYLDELYSLFLSATDDSINGKGDSTSGN